MGAATQLFNSTSATRDVSGHPLPGSNQRARLTCFV